MHTDVLGSNKECYDSGRNEFDGTPICWIETYLRRARDRHASLLEERQSPQESVKILEGGWMMDQPISAFSRPGVHPPALARVIQKQGPERGPRTLTWTQSTESDQATMHSYLQAGPADPKRSNPVPQRRKFLCLDSIGVQCYDLADDTGMKQAGRRDTLTLKGMKSYEQPSTDD